MSDPEQSDASVKPSRREPWETPVVIAAAISDTNKVLSNFAEDPFQGKAGS